MKTIPNLLLTLFLLSLNMTGYATVTVSIPDYEIPRDTSTNTFTISVKVDGIKAKKPDTNYYSTNLSFIVTEIDSNDAIPFNTPGTNSSWYITINGAEDIDAGEDDDESTMEAQLVFKGQDLQEALDSGTANSLTLKVTYDGGDGDTAAEQSITLTRTVKIATEAPAGVSTLGSHKKIVVSWTVSSAIQYSDGASAAPTGTNVYTVKANIGSVEIPAYKFSGSADTADTATTCTIDTTVENDNACVTCTGSSDDKIYINNSSLGDTNVTLKSVSSTGSKASIRVENTDESGDPLEYLVFLAYRPDGSVRSNCHKVSPQANMTLSEYLDSSQKAKDKNPACFIATAAYGTPFHHNLDLFRWFRDEYLSKSTAGRTFIELYYQYGPIAAEFISDKPKLKAVVRGLLYIPAKSLDYYNKSL